MNDILKFEKADIVPERKCAQNLVLWNLIKANQLSFTILSNLKFLHNILKFEKAYIVPDQKQEVNLDLWNLIKTTIKAFQH